MQTRTKSTTTARSALKGFVPEWQKTQPNKEIHFTADEVIEAYFKGVSEGLRKEEKAALIKLDENISLTAQYRDKVSEFLKSKGFTPKEAFLRISSWDNFTVLITVPPDDFFNKNFLVAYKFVSSIEHGIQDNPSLNLFFSFTDNSNKLNEELMASDGYVLKHPL